MLKKLAPAALLAFAFLAIPAAAQDLVAEDQTPTGQFTTATEVKPIMEATRRSWVAVREYDGRDLVYVTHIFAWRCGMVQLKLGVNGAAPEIWPLPPCHLDTNAPNAVRPEDGDIYKRYPLKSVESIAVEITYDDLTTATAEYQRKEVLMP